MKLAKGIAVLFTVLLIFGLCLPATSAERDSIKVIITTEDKIYKPEETINIEVHVFDKGVPVDAEEIYVSVGSHWYNPDEEVTVTQISTGVYQGSYLVQSDDYGLCFVAYVEKGTDADSAELEIDIYHDYLEMDIHFSNQNSIYIWPGEELKATIFTRYRGAAIDVDYFSYLRLVDPSDEVTNLTHETVTTGKYEVNCLIPEITENCVYELEARATYANTHSEASAYITVNVLSVWYHLESMAGSTATFTLGVADKNGNGVANAQINITSPQELTGYTNADGTAIFSLTNIYNGIRVSGEVTCPGKKQSFSGNIYTEDFWEPENPAQNRFDVIYDGEEYVYKPGSSITRTYKAYNCSVPMQNKEIYYYITLEGMDVAIYDGQFILETSDHVNGACYIISTGSVTCDQLGTFSISFTAPSVQGYAYIHFEAGIPRHDRNYHPQSNPEYDHDDLLVYEEDYDAAFIMKGDIQNSKRVEIESEPLKIGGKTKITVKTSDDLDYGDMLFAKWMSGISTSGQYLDEYESDWVCWVEGGNIISLKKTGDGYNGYSVIPSFLPDEGEYSFVAGYVDGETGQAYINSAELKEGEIAGKDDLEMVLLGLLFAGILMVLLGLALGAFVIGRKRGTGQDIPSEELSLDSDYGSPFGSKPSDEAPLTPSESPPGYGLYAKEIPRPEDDEGGEGKK